jgi:N-acetylmuramoyl-L-alanine amidase
MAAYHKVKQGEYMVQIAQKYGFGDFRIIWDHPENADLRQERRNPNVLYPGDTLYIPDRETKEESGATEKRHVFRVHSGPCVLRIVSKDIDGEPIANTACTLQVEHEFSNLTTDSDGMIEEGIPKTAQQGRLRINHVEVPIQIGHLDPVETDSGQQARLNNLGYYAGTLGEIEERELRSAIEEFQCDRGLPVTGICDDRTQAVLVEAHGC